MIATPADSEPDHSMTKLSYPLRARAAVIRPLLLPVALCLGLTALSALAADKSPNSACLECHSDKTLSKTNAAGKEVSLFIDEAWLKATVHKTNTCKDCHADITDQHPDDNVPAQPPSCLKCHDKETKDYATSIHGVSHKMGASGAANCWDCHGSHDIVPVKQADSPVFKLNLPRTCASCHSNPGLTKEYQMKYPEAASQYMDSIHGRALLKMGLIVAPSCNDCHGVHDIKRAVDRDSPINKANVAKTCGKCHVTVEETYNQSVHGQLLAKGDRNGPVCTDCHTAHSIQTPGQRQLQGGQRPALRQMPRGPPGALPRHLPRQSDGVGQAQCRLPMSPPATTATAITTCCRPPTPGSHLSKANILATCQQVPSRRHDGLHRVQTARQPAGRQELSSPARHVSWHDRAAGRRVSSSSAGTPLAWLFRALYLYRHDSKTFREAKISTQEGGEWFTRFLPFERFLHFLVVTSFLLLVITGMPLKFYYTDWAKTMFSIIGGADTARALHRFGAIVTFRYFGLHLASLLGRSWRGRTKFRDPQTGRLSLKRLWQVVFGPDSMMPTLQDWRDFVAHNNGSLAKAPSPSSTAGPIGRSSTTSPCSGASPSSALPG